MTSTDKQKTLRKFRRERAVGRYLLNPAVKGLSALGMRTAMAAELETIGRTTGQLRRVPVSAQFDDGGAWVICQHGTRSGWGRNLADNPNVRLRQGNQWRSGVAAFRPDDDVVARARKFGRLGARMVKALETTPVSVRIDFTG
jgi:deazaflavin-dependent oxidoreductase (nitroreductase family)